MTCILIKLPCIYPIMQLNCKFITTFNCWEFKINLSTSLKKIADIKFIILHFVDMPKFTLVSYPTANCSDILFFLYFVGCP